MKNYIVFFCAVFKMSCSIQSKLQPPPLQWCLYSLFCKMTSPSIPETDNQGVQISWKIGEYASQCRHSAQCNSGFQDVFLPDIISPPDVSLPDISLPRHFPTKTFPYQDVSLPRCFPTKAFHYQDIKYSSLYFSLLAKYSLYI